MKKKEVRRTRLLPSDRWFVSGIILLWLLGAFPFFAMGQTSCDLSSLYCQGDSCYTPEDSFSLSSNSSYTLTPASQLYDPRLTGSHPSLVDDASQIIPTENPQIIRGQSSNDYWNSVYNPYASTVYLAQNTDPASVQPTITGNVPASAPLAAPNQPASIAPPITQGTPAIYGTGTNTSSGLSEPVNKLIRFCHDLSLDYTHVCKGSEETGAGIDELNIFTEFSIPCSFLPAPPGGGNSGFLFLSPGFSVDFWSSNIPMRQTFNASLALGTRTQITPEFQLEAWVQAGLAATFKKVSSKAFYVRGKAIGTLAITEDGRFYATGGAMYLGRNHLKLLPVAGVIWRPNERNIWRLVFPDPRLDHYLGKVNETDWWGFIQGQIGGDRWLIGEIDKDFRMDYNDYRVGIGVAFESSCGFTGHIELGGAFGREFYAEGSAIYKPKSALYVKAGVSY